MVTPEIACGIMEAIGSLDPKDNFPDFTVIVEGKKFSCHRFILNACSGFFSALLRSGMKETLESTVTVNGIPSEIFALIHDCLYKGVDIVNEENVFALWHATNLLQMNFLVTKCEKFIVEKMLHENYSEIYRHARLLDSGSVLAAALELMVKDFGSFSFTSSFSHLSASDLQALIECEDLNVPSEDVVVNAVLRWVTYKPEDDNKEGELGGLWYENKTKGIEAKLEQQLGDGHRNEAGQNGEVRNETTPDKDGEKTVASDATVKQNPSGEKMAAKTKEVTLKSAANKGNEEGKNETRSRQEYLGKLLGACRICLVSPDCIESLMSNELVLDNKDALAVVREAILYHLKPGSFWPASAIHRAKSTMDNVTVFLNDKSLKAYSMRNNRLNFLGELPETDDAVGGLRVVNNQIFLIRTGGGYYTSAFSIYAFVSPKTWYKVLENSDTPYFVIPHEEFMYLVKGSVLYRFSTKIMLAGKTPTQTLCSLPINLYNHTTPAAATFGKKILLFCGSNSSISVTVLCINTLTWKVTTLSNLDGPAEKMVSFGDGKNYFLLQMNGTLLKMVDDPIDEVEFKFMTKLWGFDWNLLGAVVYKKQLFLFGTAVREERSWSQSLPGYFDEIKVIFVNSRCPCLPVTIPKSWLQEKVSSEH